MTDELKPCPFCGWPATNIFGVGCSNDNCPNENRDFQGASCITVDEWNTRPIEDELMAEIERLQAKIEEKDRLLSNVAEYIKDKSRGK